MASASSPDSNNAITRASYIPNAANPGETTEITPANLSRLWTPNPTQDLTVVRQISYLARDILGVNGAFDFNISKSKIIITLPLPSVSASTSVSPEQRILEHNPQTNTWSITKGLPSSSPLTLEQNHQITTHALDVIHRIKALALFQAPSGPVPSSSAATGTIKPSPHAPTVQNGNSAPHVTVNNIFNGSSPQASTSGAPLDLSARTARIEDLTRRVTELTHLLAQAEARAASSSSGASSSLPNDATQQEISRLQQDLAATRGALQAQQEESQNLRAHMGDLTSNRDALQEQLDQVAVLSAENAALRGWNASLEQERRSVQQAHAALEAQMETLQTELTKAQAKNNNLQERLTAATTRAAVASAPSEEVTQLRAQAATWQNILHNLNQQITAGETALQEIKAMGIPEEKQALPLKAHVQKIQEKVGSALEEINRFKRQQPSSS